MADDGSSRVIHWFLGLPTRPTIPPAKPVAVPIELPLFRRAVIHGSHKAIVDAEGTLTYRQLLDRSARVAGVMLDAERDLNQARVVFLAPPGRDYVAVQWGIWRAGGVAVPLCERHPPPEWEYVIDDTRAEVIVAHPRFAESLRPLAEARGLRFLLTSERSGDSSASLPQVEPTRRAMILYTSGTTARPKGVVATHANIQAQVETLIEAWRWTADDRILHVLPLHHVHGIINVLTCSLWAGATCEMLPRFDASAVWARLACDDADNSLTLFMAVPTIYARLIAAWESASPKEQAAMSRGCKRLRLMVSGSAALPVATLERWQQISGHVLLERYGMTEIGMALSNPLDGPRRPGHVGTPLPGVEVRLVDEAGDEVPPGASGEIEVRGPSVFAEYWRQPDATRAAFRDGWFRSGDVAVVEDGSYRILGRSSVDIIKTGGYKVSALEIEDVLRTHPLITDCAVVGIEDPEWGERVAAAIVPTSPDPPTLDELRDWTKQQLADYKVPTRLHTLDNLPRNAMGKVNKPAVKGLFASNP